MKKQLLILTTLIIASISYAQTFTDNFITYNVTSALPDTVEITAYDVSGGTVVNIPASVEDNGTTYEVTSIANLAFVNKGLTSISIPNSVLTIGLGAFQSNALTTVVLPDGLTAISNNMFAVNQLSSVVIPNNVTSIGNNAFSNNNQLASVTIPEGVATIGDNAFLNNQLSTITLPSTLVSIGIGAFVNNPLVDVTSLATTPPSMTNSGQGTFTIPGNIDLYVSAGTSAAYAGSTWSAFNSITEIINIGDIYVSNFISYELTSMNPNLVSIVDYDVAGGTSVTIPASVVNGLLTYDVIEIDIQAFDNKGLTSLAFSLPSNVETIGGFSFRNNQLTSLDIPDSVTNIGGAAFETNQLTSVNFTNNITSIGGTAFAFNQLSTVSIHSGISDLSLGIFQYNQITSVTIPNTITTISAGAFENNQLTSITIPNSITNIGARAFKDNPLTSVYSEGLTPPTIVTQNGIFDSFNSDRSNIHLHIPAGTMGAYVTDSGALWTGFNPVTEDALSVDEFDLSSAVKVITNPDAIHVIANTNIRLEHFTLFNISGAKVATGTESEIPTSYFAGGIYILKLDFDKGTTVKKVAIN